MKVEGVLGFWGIVIAHTLYRLLDQTHCVVWSFFDH